MAEETMTETRPAALGDMPQLVSVRQAAQVLNCSGRHVMRLCERGELKAVKLGRLWRINRDALAARCGL